MEKKPIDRVKIIIDNENLSISAFEKATGMSNNSIQTAIKRRSNLKDDTLNSILNTFQQYNPAWLLTGKGSMKKYTDQSESPAVLTEPIIKYNLPQVVVMDSHDRENIPMVPVRARAGYLDGYYKPEYIRSLPMYRVPGLNNGTFRMFEMKGHSMHPTLPNKSVAVGEWVEDWVENIKDGRVYIIITDDWEQSQDGVLIKRCINRIEKYNNLMCKSDNLDRSSYPNINLDPKFIKEVWEVKGAFLFEFPDPSHLFTRIDNLEAELEEIKRHLQ